jgi:hypothetical protein
MKTKKLFLIAAMLLMSVCSFAQNGNNPLKGDVNEDGTVDVADLVSVIQIMKDAGGAVGEKMYYWYAGVNGGNAVTGDNFTNVASRIAESQIPETGSVTASSQYVYIVMPETRHISSLTNANGATVGYDCVDAFGYHIYKTSERVNGTINYATAETIYYWYVGVDQPTGVDSSWRTSNSDAGFTKTVTIGAGFTWFAYPDTWTYIAKDSYNDRFDFNAFVPAATKTSIPGYIILKGPKMSSGDIITITFSK